MFALVQAVHAGHAAAVVYLVILDVDTRGFAVTGTEVTINALVCVDDRLQVSIL